MKLSPDSIFATVALAFFLLLAGCANHGPKPDEADFEGALTQSGIEGEPLLVREAFWQANTVANWSTNPAISNGRFALTESEVLFLSWNDQRQRFNVIFSADYDDLSEAHIFGWGQGRILLLSGDDFAHKFGLDDTRDDEVQLMLNVFASHGVKATEG